MPLAIPENGPAVWTVIVTLVLPALTEENAQNAPAGSPEQAKVKGAVKVPAPTGDIVMMVDVDCPGFAAGGFEGAEIVTSVFTVRVTA